MTEHGICRLRLIVSVLVLWLTSNQNALCQESRSATTQWQPARCWAFVIGVLEWEKNRFAAFPKEKRRDQILVDTLKKRGVPSSQIHFLKDSKATTQAVADELPKFLKRAGQNDWILIYYAGHGYHSPDHQTTLLASYNTGPNTPGLSVAALPLMIEQHFRGSHVMIAFDCCNAGAIAKAVNALPRTDKSYAALASSHFNSSSTPNWTFTENLIYALDGEEFMDDDGDGSVTFQELADNVTEDMTFAEHQMPQFAFTGRFKQGVVIAKSEDRVSGTIGQRGRFRSGGAWYPGFTIDKDGERRKVRYYGYSSADDEWVDPQNIEMQKQSPTKPVGTRVQVLWGGQWYKARIVAVRKGLHLVKYDDWSKDWNEWVPISRIR